MEKLKNLLEAEALCDNGDTIFHQDIEQRKNKELIQFLLEQGAEVNAKNNHGQTSLHYTYATFDKVNYSHYTYNTEMTKFLMEHGADINTKDNRGDTPLHTICYDTSSVAKEKFFSKFGTDPTALSRSSQFLFSNKTNEKSINHKTTY